MFISNTGLTGALAVSQRILVQLDVSDLLSTFHTHRASRSIPRYNPAHPEQRKGISDEDAEPLSTASFP